MKRVEAPEVTIAEMVFVSIAVGIMLILFFMGPMGVAKASRNGKNNGLGGESGENSAAKGGSLHSNVDDGDRSRSTTLNDSTIASSSAKSNIAETGMDGLSDQKGGAAGGDSPGRMKSRTRRASEFIRRRFESWNSTSGSPRATSTATSVSGTLSENGDGECDSPSNSKQQDSPQSKEPDPPKEEIDDRLSLYLSGTRGDMNYVSESKSLVKKGRLFTLGGRKPLEKPPKVKLRLFNLAGYRLSYVDSYGLRKDFDIRDCTIEIKTVIGTRGAVEGQTLFAILLNCDMYDRSLLLGASTEAYRDEWVETLKEQQKLLEEIEEELSGEEDNYLYKGLPSPAEQALLLAPLHPRIKGVVTDANQAVRRRLYSDNDEVEMFGGSRSSTMGRGRRSMATRPNDVHIQNPLHPSTDWQSPDTPGSARTSESSQKPFSTFASFNDKDLEDAGEDSVDVWESRDSQGMDTTKEGDGESENVREE